jgi:hypothetical protein
LVKPKCSEWLEADESMMAMRFIRYFRDLNADLAATIPAINSDRTLLDLALATTATTALRDQIELLDTLKTQEKHAVLYILDEHNELFREPAGGNSFLHNHPERLGFFTRWTGPTGGVRNILNILLTLHRSAQ